MEYKQKLERLRESLKEEKLDAILVSSIANITYLTGFSNFSRHEREAFLVITATKQYVITDARYSEAVQREIPDFELLEISSQKLLKAVFEDLSKEKHIKKFGIEENNITVTEQKLISKYFNTVANSSILKLRMIKNDSEIHAIQKACKLGDKTFDYILGKIKEGISEKELEFKIEFFMKKNHAEISFPPIVAFGANSSVPHHATSDQTLATNDIILLDFGVKLNNYCSDMTRTIFFGNPPDQFKKMYQTVLDAQQKAIELLTSHFSPFTSGEKTLKGSEVNNVARNHIIQHNYPSIPHSLGHGIGLEVHESPRLSPTSKDTLKREMVFSVEPGIYIPGFGGVRIEDLVALTDDHVKILTHSNKKLIAL